MHQEDHEYSNALPGFSRRVDIEGTTRKGERPRRDGRDRAYQKERRYNCNRIS